MSKLPWRRKGGIHTTNKNKKLLTKKNIADRCTFCGRELDHHHWLCDDCYEKKEEGKWVPRRKDLV